jgi:mRNA-degrading endonuclease RelE of RelBE toxin-antitoxin system
MTSKIDKFLAKLDAERQEKVLVVLLQIQSGNFENLDIKKLKSFEQVYRVRVGQCRIKFETSKTGINIIDIDFKNDNTYKH